MVNTVMVGGNPDPMPVALDSVEQAAQLCSLLAVINWDLPTNQITQQMIIRGQQIVFNFLLSLGKLPGGTISPFMH
jgi:hypothetical protein